MTRRDYEKHVFCSGVGWKERPLTESVIYLGVTDLFVLNTGLSFPQPADPDISVSFPGSCDTEALVNVDEALWALFCHMKRFLLPPNGPRAFCLVCCPHPLAQRY